MLPERNAAVMIFITAIPGHTAWCATALLGVAGISMQVKQDSTAAQQNYEEAIAVCNGYAPAHYSLGVTLAAHLKVPPAWAAR